MWGIDRGRELNPRLTVDVAVCRRGDLDDDAGRGDGRVLLFGDLDVPVAIGFVELDAPHVRSDREDTPLFSDPTRTLVFRGDCPRRPGQHGWDVDRGPTVVRERRVDFLAPAVVKFGAGLF